MNLQELYITLLLLLVALFLQELARRITQPLSKLSQEKKTITYYDFVRDNIFYPRLQKQDSPYQTTMSIVVFTFIEGISSIVWLAPVWLFATSIPKVPIPEANIFNFLYFTLHFWVIFFIAVSVFLPYWLLGWYSFWMYERRVQAHKGVPYQGLFTPDEAGRKFHKDHFALRVKSWLVLFGLTLIVAIISLFPLHS